MSRKTTEINKDIENLEKRRKEISQSQQDMKQEMWQIRKKEDELYTEKLQPLVGLFFKDKNYVFMISDTPQPPMTLMPQSPNFYQIPTYAFELITGELNYETFYSKACESTSDNIIKDFCGDRYEQITFEEFIGTINEKLVEKIGFPIIKKLEDYYEENC